MLTSLEEHPVYQPKYISWSRHSNVWTASSGFKVYWPQSVICADRSGIGNCRDGKLCHQSRLSLGA